MAIKKKVTAKKATTKKTAKKVAAKKTETTAKATTKKVAKKAAPKKSSTQEFTFEYYSPDSKDLFVAGTFSDWQMEKMKKNKNGVWTYKAKLPKGEFQYKYVFEGVSWETDPNAPAIQSEHGLNNLLVIE